MIAAFHWPSSSGRLALMAAQFRDQRDHAEGGAGSPADRRCSKDPGYAEAKRKEEADWRETQSAMRTLEAQRAALEAQRARVSAPELMSAFMQNEVAADEKYKGKVLIVDGEVEKIGKDILDSPYVTLKTGQPITSVQCMFPAIRSHDLASLQIGSSVVIRGKCNGKLMNVILRDCELF